MPSKALTGTSRRKACLGLLAHLEAAALCVLVGAAPGGPSDFLSRLMAEQIAPALDQPVPMENEPGASGAFAAEAVAQAARERVPLAVIGAGHAVARDQPQRFDHLSLRFLHDHN